MYDIDGDFGRVRHVLIPPDTPDSQGIDVPFHFIDAGWHHCNELYHFSRKNGKDGHLLLFSLSDGGMLQLADQAPVRIPASSAAWVPPRIRHAYYTEPGKLWEFYWLDIEEDVYLNLSAIFDDHSLLSIAHIDAISSEIERFIRSRNMNAQDFRVESSRMIGNVYHTLMREFTLQKKTGKQDDLVHRIIQQMESHCEQEWPLSELSKQYFISVPQLIRRFKAETGMTPHAYLMTIRLQTARIYLKHTNLSVDEISCKTGFQRASNFILQFRNFYGVTPKKYRGS